MTRPLEFNRKRILWAILGIIFYSTGYWVFSDTLTMTAFYPSPMGVYYRMTTTDQTTLAYQTGSVYVGFKPANPQPSDPKVTIQGANDLLSVQNSGASPLLYVTNAAVGIGTKTPAQGATLDVASQATGAGAIHLGTTAGSAGSGCLTRGLIEMVGAGSSAQPMWCDGSAWQSLQSGGGGSVSVCDADIDPSCNCAGPSPCVCKGGSGSTCYIAGGNPSCPSNTTLKDKYYPAQSCTSSYSGVQCSYTCYFGPPCCYGGATVTTYYTCTTPANWGSNVPSSCCVSYGSTCNRRGCYRTCSSYGWCYGSVNPPYCDDGNGHTCPASTWSTVKCQVN